jgi:hypothetical protein
MKLTFKGITAKVYRGSDPERKTNFTAKAGDTVDVSEAKAKQILKDYPADWVIAGKVDPNDPPAVVETTLNSTADEPVDDLPDISASAAPGRGKKAKSKRR